MRTSDRGISAVAAGLAVVGVLALVPPGELSASPGASGSSGASSAGGDEIARVRITLKPARVTIEMTSGVTCRPTLRRPFSLPPAGSYQGSKSPGRKLSVLLRGRRWTTTFLHVPSSHACGAVLRAQGRFLVEVWATPADAAAANRNSGSPTSRGSQGPGSRRSGRVTGKTSGAQAGPGRRGNAGHTTSAIGSGRAGGVPDASANPTAPTGELARVRGRAHAMAGGEGQDARSLADKVARGERITYAEALALVEAKGGDIAREQSGRFSQADWEKWADFLLANRDQLTGHVRVDRDAMSLREVKKLLAEYKRQAAIIDPPTVTGTQLQAQLAVDPVLIESWNNLAPWERAMWNEYWQRLPDATQSGRAVRDLRMTQSVRFHIALQSSVGHMREGFREAAHALFNDRTFMAIVVGGITLYAITILAPEPLFSKVTAAGITTFLLATSFTLSEIIDVVRAWFRLRRNAGRARSMAALDAAARDFGTSIGGAGFRILLTLFTYFAGRALPTPKVGAPVGPASGGAITGGGAAVAALPRVAFIEGTRLVVLENGAVIIAPAAIAAVTVGGASSGGGHGGGTGGSSASTSSGGTTGASSSPSRVWPRHHPFPRYLGGAVDQTLKKIPRRLHYRFHSALDKWKGGKYARSKGAAHFKGMSKKQIIKDLREFYRTAEGGVFRKYLPDFENAVRQSR